MKSEAPFISRQKEKTLQNENEKRYPVNPICDRKTVNFFKGQTGFLGFCVKPLVVELCAFIKDSDPPEAESTLALLQRYESHIDTWKEKVEKDSEPQWPEASQARGKELTWNCYTLTKRVRDSLTRAHALLGPEAPQ